MLLGAEGRGIYCGDSDNAFLSVSDGTISGNEVAGSGGGFAYAGVQEARVIRSSVSLNYYEFLGARSDLLLDLFVFSDLFFSAKRALFAATPRNFGVFT